MRRYSLFQALPLSFFSRDLYRDVGRNWKGVGLIYLLLLVTLITLSILFRMQLAITQWARDDGVRMVDQLPTIRIQHGVVQVDRATPITITDRRGTAIAIIDTSSSPVSLEGSKAEALLTRNRLYVRKSAAETRVFDLSRIESFTLDRARAKRWLRMLTTLLAVAIVPFILVGLYAFRLIQQLIGSVVIFLIARASNLQLDFSARMRVAAVALTPALLIEVVLFLANVSPPFWGLVWCAITLGCYVFAVRAITEAEPVAPGTEMQVPNAPT